VSDLDRMIRPWYRGGYLPYDDGAHLYADCEVLAEEGEPREGVGWLDPLSEDVCGECARRHDPEAYERRIDDDY
jgi:hypothetical protein